MSKFQLSVLVELFLGCFWHFRVLAHFNCTIVQDVYSYFFIWRYLVDKFGDDVKFAVDHVAKTAWISHLEKNIVDATNVEVFYMSRFEIIDDTMSLHLVIDGSIATWS